MGTIYLLRHGETQWNRQKRVQGHGDSPLTLKGIEQARAYGRTLAGLISDADSWHMVSSPLPRCLQTTAILCETAGFDYAQVQHDGRLREVSTGKWSGRLKAELSPEEREGSGANAWFFRCPGGETYDHMADRLRSWLDEHRNDGRNHLVISHGVAGRILRGLYLGWDAERTIAGDSPQDAFFKLENGQVERIPVSRDGSEFQPQTCP